LGRIGRSRKAAAIDSFVILAIGGNARPGAGIGRSREHHYGGWKIKGQRIGGGRHGTGFVGSADG
jgi:hypothetical protein